MAALNSKVADRIAQAFPKNRADGIIPPRYRTPITCPSALAGDSISEGRSPPLAKKPQGSGPIKHCAKALEKPSCAFEIPKRHTDSIQASSAGPRRKGAHWT